MVGGGCYNRIIQSMITGGEMVEYTIGRGDGYELNEIIPSIELAGDGE